MVGDVGTRNLCDRPIDGEACKMTLKQALRYCIVHHTSLPSIKEIVSKFNPTGVSETFKQGYVRIGTDMYNQHEPFYYDKTTYDGSLDINVTWASSYNRHTNYIWSSTYATYSVNGRIYDSSVYVFNWNKDTDWSGIIIWSPGGLRHPYSYKYQTHRPFLCLK